MKLEYARLIEARIPLKTSFKTSFGVQTDKVALLLEVGTDVGTGWGECVALPDPVYSEEFIDGCKMVIIEHLFPRLTQESELEPALVAKALASIKGHRMAKAAIEMALLDADLRSKGQPLSRFLGGDRPRVLVGVSVGIASSLSELLEWVRNYVAQGYSRVKLKVQPGWDVEPVRAVREEFGSALGLQVDANSAYLPNETSSLQALDEFGLLLIEQPFAEDDLSAHASLAERISTPICLDESITSARAAVHAISVGACSIVNIKAGRVGGYIEASKIHDACRDLEVPVWCGGMLETGLGRAANLALASLPNFTFPGDVSATDRYFTRDITDPFKIEDGYIEVPTGPGLGVEVHRETLDDYTAETIQIEF